MRSSALFKMKKAYLIFPDFWRADGSARTVGGIQTYILNLSRILEDQGYQTLVIQLAYYGGFEVMDGSINVIGVNSKKNLSELAIAKKLFSYVERVADFTCDLIIYCSDLTSVPTKYKRTILIQHGISWDIPLDILPNGGFLRWLSTRYQTLGYLRKIYQGYRYSKQYLNAHNRVCVDYNYQNWRRTLAIREPTGKSWVIPNCVFPGQENLEINGRSYCGNDSNRIRVLFARRFEPYRGSRVMVDAIKLVLAKSENIFFTFAGEGQDYKYIEKNFQNENRVSITRYDADQSILFHKQFDIAVVPSQASEGISLSLLEAMAAGCACIGTPVGGITNIIIDGFNGLFASFNDESLADTILKLAFNSELRKRLQGNAEKIISEGPFNHREWSKRWMEVIEYISKLD